MTSPLVPPFNPSNVLVGASALYIAPANTPLPADSSVLFDPTNWTGKTINPNGATALTIQATNSAGTGTTSSLTVASLTSTALQAALAALPNIGAGNVTVTGSTGGPFTVVVASALGATTLAITASTGGTGPTISGGLWTPPGATEAGWTFGTNKTTQDITIEEQSTPAGVTLASQNVQISGNLSEDTQANWQLSMNAVKSQIAAGVGQPGITMLTLSDNLLHYAVALESINEYGYATRKYIPDTICAESLSVQYRRAQAQRMLAVTFRSVCATNRIISRAVTAPGS